MDWFARWPPPRLSLGLLIATLLLLAAVVIAGLRAWLLVKLSFRNIARRRLRAAMIVFGLMLSTTVVGSALGAGNTIAHTLRSAVNESFGAVDEIVVTNPPRRQLARQLRALAEPGIRGLAAANLGFFDEQQVADVVTAASRGPAIAGVVPAVLEQVTVVVTGSQQLQSAIPLVALPTAYPAAFGRFQQTGGTPIAMESLGPAEVVINQAAAALLKVRPGSELAILRDRQRWTMRVRAVVGDIGIATVEPLVIVPLPHYQRLIGRERSINLLLVANQGGGQSVQRTAEATSALRGHLVNRAAAEDLRRVLARPEVQHALEAYVQSLPERDARLIAALRHESTSPTLTEEFISLLTEPRVRARLYALAWGLPGVSNRQTAVALLDQVASLSVLPVKQEALDQAIEYGSIVTTIFLVLGIFSIAAAVLLIFLIFALLAADRGAELATMRALGMRGRQIMGMFLLEGMIYNLVGALLGALASIGAQLLIVALLARALQSYGIRLDSHVELRALALAFASGFWLTGAAMLFASWRASRLRIVAATRGEAIAERNGGLWGVLLLLFAALLWWRWRAAPVRYMPHPALVTPLLISLVLIGGTRCLQWVLSLRKIRARYVVEQWWMALVGLAIAGGWLRALSHVPSARATLLSNAVALAIGGLCLVLACVWASAQLLAPLLRAVDHALWDFGRLRAVVRPAAAYLARYRWRTGMTIAMFATVISIVALALTLIHVVLVAYAGDEAPVAGFDLRADPRTAMPFEDLETALAAAPAVSRAVFGAIGAVAMQDVQAVPLGLPAASWQTERLAVVDRGFLGGVRVGMQSHARGYGRSEAIWRAVGERPGTAVVTARTWRSLMGAVDPPDQDMVDPVVLWVKPSQGGQPIRLEIAGVVAARSRLDDGIYISQATAAGLAVALENPGTYFFAVSPRVRLRDAAEGLRVSFGERGLGVTILGETERVATMIRLLLTRIVQGFMGLGLIAGVTALGLLGVQAVHERRQQLGTLRALGLTRGQVRATMIAEAAVVASAGILLGIGLGLFLAHTVVALLAVRFPEIRYTVPWQDITMTTSVAGLGAIIAITLAARQAGRVAPAEAMRAS